MAVHVIRVPDLGEGIAEVELVVWHLAAGDSIVEDQGLADVMTDKASVEIPSPVAGKVLALGGEVGQMLAVGSELIRIEVGTRPRRGRRPTGWRGGRPASPSRRRHRCRCQYRRRWHRQRCRHRHRQRTPRRRSGRSPAGRPRARRELGIDLGSVSTTGTAGRVVQADLDAHLARGGARSNRPASAGAAPATDATHAIKIVGLRRKIAQKMQESKRRIPHYSYVEEVDVTEVEALRAELNAKWGAERGRLTMLAFLVRAVALAVREFPMVNARFDDEAGVVTRHDGPSRRRDADTRRPGRSGRAQRAGQRPVGGAAEIARLADAARSGRSGQAQQLDDHDHEPGAARRHRHDAGDQPSRGRDRRRQQIALRR